MGADFMCVVLPICRWTCEREIALTMKVNDADVADPCIEFLDLPRADGLSDKEDIEWVAREVQEAKDSVISALRDYWFDLGGRRDIGVIMIDGIDYMVTGGLSWGDAPTDAYEIMEKLSGLWDELKTYAVLDREKNACERVEAYLADKLALEKACVLEEGAPGMTASQFQKAYAAFNED